MKTVNVLASLLALPLLCELDPAIAWAQGCCSHGGSAAGNGVASHSGHLASPGNGMHANPSPIGHGGMCLGSSCSSTGKAPDDILHWPLLLQKPAFTVHRQQIEVPYRRSPEGQRSLTPSDYRGMASAVDKMKGTVEWFAGKGVELREIQEARTFLTQLSEEINSRIETLSSKLPSNGTLASGERPKTSVSVAKVEASDQPAITKQQVCPVSRAMLGSMGGPVKVLVGEHALYLCCPGCIAKVKESPEKFVLK